MKARLGDRNGSRQPRFCLGCYCLPANPLEARALRLRNRGQRLVTARNIIQEFRRFL